MKKILPFFIIIIVFTMIGLIACEETIGPQGAQGEPGVAYEPELVIDLDTEITEITVIIGVNQRLSAKVNPHATVHTLIWELCDEVSAQILRLDRTPVTPESDRSLKVTGSSVIATGLADGEAAIVITALGSGAIPEQKTVNVTVKGLTTDILGLPERIAAGSVTSITLTAHGSELIMPQRLDFFNDDEIASGRQLSIIVKGDKPGVVLGVNGSGALFTVGRGINLILEDITLRGIGGNDRPLVIVEEGATLTLRSNSGITDNINLIPASTATSPYLGGGVHVRARARLYLEGGEISGNRSAWGGGVYNEGTFTITEGTVLGNFSDTGAGVVNSDLGTFAIHGGSISRNSAVTINTNNNRVDGFGGGLFNLGIFTMDNGEISENYTDQGGGVACQGTFTMTGGRIHSNEGRVWGGGVAKIGGTFTMRAGDIDNNYTSYDGGGLAGGGGGAGMMLARGGFTFYNGKIHNNTTSNSGGGVNIQDRGVLTMSPGAEISENLSRYGGGGIQISGGGTFNMLGGKVDSNESLMGGGVNIDDGHISVALFNMKDGVISNNVATAFGGGVRIGNPVRTSNVLSGYRTLFEMEGGEIFGNQSLGTGLFQGGGGVAVIGVFIMRDGSIYNNSTGNNGGGIRISQNGLFEMHGGEIYGNTAVEYGGGISHHGPPDFPNRGTQFRISNGKIYGSEAAAGSKGNTSVRGGDAFIIMNPIDPTATNGTGSDINFAQYGTLIGDVWTKNGDLVPPINNTITVINGVLQP